jgi:putative transposase
VEWVRKYRYNILRGDIAERARDVIRQICMAREVTIVRGAVSPDHVHVPALSRSASRAPSGGFSRGPTFSRTRIYRL